MADKRAGCAWGRWAAVVFFAAAMAWMEAATVVYLRLLVGRLDPYQADPLPLSGFLGRTELVREAATMVMLLAVGLLAGRDWRRRLGYFLIAFGVWDILYYVFLAAIGGWPRSLLDWDILFLLPLPWWGPVIAPAAIAALMVAGGTLATQFGAGGRPIWPRPLSWAANAFGILLALYAFTADALAALPHGAAAVRSVLPVSFRWPVFAVGLVLIAAPLADMAAQIRRSRRAAASLPREAP
jgi:hypothetical protein